MDKDDGDDESKSDDDQIPQTTPVTQYDYLAEKAKNIEKNREIMKKMGFLNASDSVLGRGEDAQGGKGKGKGRKGKKGNQKSRLIRTPFDTVI